MIGRSTLLILTVGLFTGCFRVETETIVLEVPKMTSLECAQVLQRVLSEVQGVESVEPDIQNQVLTVRYHSVTIARKNIEYVVSGAGFEIADNDAPVDPEKRKALPENCR